MPSPAFSGDEKISILICPFPSTFKAYSLISGSSSLSEDCPSATFDFTGVEFVTSMLFKYRFK